ncbi:Alg9-like mannosyltransferase family-domain-containing protein [Phyllosticta capitalensis]|uniref:Alg9-like mannosyltransferase family-domain-containing protein n=1 Tax=Phyllosticta capitalensis TaxID=121624 RepID=UPI00312E407C
MPRPAATHVDSDPSKTSSAGHVLLLLLALRILNALTTRTFFQPDEYFQALEPAWQMAFGEASGAWITWEWKNQLRSSLHPALFAAVLALCSRLADACSLSASLRADLLIAAPKITQATFAALVDYFTWRLAEHAHGRGSRAAWASLALTICSPWQWFCSTRTLSNCLETTLTSAALVWWPWRWVAQRGSPTTTFGDRPHLKLSLVAAAFACVLRPTNLLVWICICLPTLWQASSRERHALVQSAVLYGGGVLALSAIADRIYYGMWTLPPLRFVYFNIARSLAVFYGTNRPDYYLTEGLPLLLTTALPFAIWGMYASLLRSDGSRPRHLMLSSLSFTVLTMVFALSFISHKEVRFIYPLLPILHVLAAEPLSIFFRTPLSLPKSSLLALLLFLNLLLAVYSSQVHQRGVIDVLHFLRTRHVDSLSQTHPSSSSPNTTDVAFLMPCHSTPWRSHLVHPSLSAWALTCEPPLDVPLALRAAYRDEADRFYLEDEPARWLQLNMRPVSTIASSPTPKDDASGSHAVADADGEHRRPWPAHLVFFAQLEPLLARFLRDTTYQECWRGFNSHFHDDWRRRGDVVVWCLDGTGREGMGESDRGADGQRGRDGDREL